MDLIGDELIDVVGQGLFGAGHEMPVSIHCHFD
jgi:hypothetical protein